MSGPIPNPKLISIHTSCMGRAFQVKECLSRNLAVTARDANVEFVLLNYSSLDELDEIIRNEFMGFIEAGRLRYFVHPDEVFFRFAHARNMAAKLCRGAIISNVDADIQIGPAYLELVRQTLKRHYKFCMAKKMSGWMAMHRSLFFTLGGYDEKFDDGYGFEDRDLLERALRFGAKGTCIGKPPGYGRLKHPGLWRNQFGRNQLTTKESRDEHEALMKENGRQGVTVVNTDHPWGAGWVYDTTGQWFEVS